MLMQKIKLNKEEETILENICIVFCLRSGETESGLLKSHGVSACEVYLHSCV